MRQGTLTYTAREVLFFTGDRIVFFVTATMGRDRPRSQRFLLSKGAEIVCYLGPLIEWVIVLLARPRVAGRGPMPTKDTC